MKKLLLNSVCLLLLLISNSVFAQPISGNKTIGTGGSYGSLTAAFTAINSAGINGSVLLELLSNYSSSSETFPITIPNISGVSANNTITIRPQSGATGLSIASANATATIIFSGSKYITFDGRPGGTGTTMPLPNTANLIIGNTNTAGIAIIMQNDAVNNTIKYCDLQGVNATNGQVPGTPAGIVFIGTTNGTTGNDNNTIDFCNIHPPSNTSVCTLGIYSYGPASTTIDATFNDNNTISNCNIYDMYGGASATTAAIELEKGTNGWNIISNHIFQTTSRSPTITAAVTNRGIYLIPTNGGGLGNGYTITGNYIGGGAPFCAGSPYTINPSGSFNSLFDGITLNVSGGNASNVKSNVITNLSISQGASTSDLFHGIWCQNAGNVNIGGPNPSDGNTVGSTTATGAITLNSLGAGLTHNPIIVASGSSTVNTIILIQNNKVGGFDLVGAGNAFSGIFCNGAAPTVVIDRNLVGSLTVKNSINAINNSSSYVCFVNGIRSPSGSATLTITNNIVANLNNNSTSTTSSSGVSNTSISQTAGINILGASTATQIINSISGNMVKNLSCAAFHLSNYVNTVLVGIGTVASGGNPTIISNNVVDSLVSTTLSSGSSGQNMLMTGIFYFGTTSSTTIISNNFVHSFDLVTNNPGCSFRGIEIIGGPVLAANNMIRLGVKPDGTDLTFPIYIYALLTESSSPHTLYHNTVYVGGAGVTGGANPSYAFWRYNVATDDFRNNIFINNRSNATGNTAKHYAVVLAGTASLTMNYNIYNANGTGGIFANNGTADVAYSSGWVSGDVNSYTTDPGLINPAGNATAVNLHLTAPNLKGLATATTGINDDIDGDKRSTPPEIGADEFPFDAGVSAIDAPTTASFCGQSKPIIVHIKNYGLLPLTAANINITVNGTFSYFYGWTGNLAAGATSGAINLGSYNFSGGTYKLSVSTTLLNGQVDNNANNDTASVSFNVTPSAFPTIAITTLNNTVCINTPVTFKAVFTNGGTSPVLQWKVNSVNVGTNDTVYTSSALANGDTVTCVVTSNAPCATPAVVTSNLIKMTVGVTLPPSVTIASNDTNICAGANSSFKATIINGGSTPHYKWIKNGVVVGSDSIGFKLFNPSNKDSVRCIMTSNLSCASKSADTSKYIILNVNPLLTPTVSITSTATNFCAGLADTFTATITNGGTFPVYNWRLNAGQFVGTNNSKFITTTLNNNDSIYVVFTSNASCLATNVATSNKIGVKVTPVVSPAVTITATKNALCAGESVNFVATPLFGGLTPSRKWYKNAIEVGSNTDSLTLTNLQNQDSIYYVLVSSAPCIATSPTVNSNVQRMNVSQFITPDITLSASTTSICNGASIKFSAVPFNTGITPHYVWRKNGIIVGSDDTVFTTSVLNNKDTISVVLLANNFCQTKSSDTSANIIVTVTPTVTPTIAVSTTANPICEAAQTLFSANITNGGTSPHFTWMKNGLTIGSDSIALLTNLVTHRDTIYVVLNSSANCKTVNNVVSNKLLMLVSPAVNAEVTITESANPICQGKSVTFNTSLVNAGGAPKFQWMRNSNKVGTDINNYITDSVNDADSFYVMMTSSVMCATPAVAKSNKVGMKVNKNETPKVTVTASTNTACTGQAVTFTATDSAVLTNKLHQWYRNGVKVGTDSLNYTIAVVPGDKVMCILKASGSCVTKIADTSSLTITVNPVPTKPVITRVQDTLKSSVSPSYQWYLNNNALSGETNRTLRATQNGTYKVMAESLGCKSTSDTFGFYHVAVHEVFGSDYISVYPNPTNKLIFVDADFATNVETEITLTDISGKELLHYTKEKSTSIKNEPINLDELNQGVYLIHIVHGESSSVSKVIKE